MPKRLAITLILLLFSGIAAIFAAGHLGITLPWDTADNASSDPASKNREPSASGKSAEAIIEETAKGLSGAEPTQPAKGGVALDVSRISPDGLSVFAGRAEPHAYVTVMENGKPAGTVRAGEDGDWSLATEHKFASTDPKITFEVSSAPPPEPVQTAEAKPAASSKTASASSAAGDVMRNFENLVSEAREEAAREKADEERKKAEAAAEPPAAVATQEPADGRSDEQSTAAKTDTPAASADVAAAPSAPQASESAAAPSTKSEADTANNDTAGPASSAAVATAASERNAPSASASGQIAIPVPIMFVYNEATLTPEGKRAADLLLEYLTLKRLSAVELTGHADERGTGEYNYELSRERLDTVSDLLKSGGYSGELKLIPKGKTEPYMGVDRTRYSGEALHQLDRRVELRINR